MIAKKRAQDFPGSIVYFTEADPSAQVLYNITPEEFSAKMKLWLLLADHAVLSVGHMLESNITFDWLTANSQAVAELAQDEAVVPSLREDRDGFRDFVVQAPEQEDSPSVLVGQRDVLLGRASVLSDVFSTAVCWPPTGESRWFRDSMAADLARRDSPLRRRLVGVRTAVVDRLAGEIASREFLKREELTRIIRKHCPERERLLRRYGDVFYHMAGAVFKDAVPVLHPGAAALFRQKVADAVRSTATPSGQQGELWRDILDAWGLTFASLQRLPLSEVVQIRHDSLGVKLRRTWGTLLRRAGFSKVVRQNIAEFDSARIDLIRLLHTEVGAQRRRYSTVQKVRSALEVGSWVTAGLGYLVGLCLTSDPVVSLVSGALGLAVGKPVLDGVGKRLPKTELVVVAARIVGRG
ncbi:MAG: hypothetical protein JSU73_05765 [candidate division WOR-3 bacterium]|nr:MAG: hypothetical protein JSU73_05765 [candidate division WOR-3 bacterium]